MALLRTCLIIFILEYLLCVCIVSVFLLEYRNVNYVWTLKTSSCMQTNRLSCKYRPLLETGFIPFLLDCILL